MSYYSIVTIYPDHISTTEMPTLSRAQSEFDYRRAVISTMDPENIKVRLLRISEYQILDITPSLPKG